MNLEHKTRKADIVVNDVRKKALHWWRALSKEMKLSMVHNPNVNKTEMMNVGRIGSSSIQVERMFKNWLSWEIGNYFGTFLKVGSIIEKGKQ